VSRRAGIGLFCGQYSQPIGGRQPWIAIRSQQSSERSPEGGGFPLAMPPGFALFQS
jgi:hypothetical protein